MIARSMEPLRALPHPTHLLLASVAAAALCAGCGDDGGAVDGAGAVDISGDSSVADVGTADTSGAAVDVSADAGETSPDPDDSSIDSDTGPQASVPWNMGPPDVDLESPAGLRSDPVTYTVPGLETERAVDVHLWYPTDDDEGEGHVYLIFPDDFAWIDASVRPAAGPGKAPLLVYSHGGRGFATQISTVARQFVRNGWIVAAPSHPGHILDDYVEPLPYSFPATRAFDVIAAIDYVESLPADHPLSGRVDTSRVLVMGHSFGGQNAWILGGLPFDLEGLQTGCGEGCSAADLAAFEAYDNDPRVVAGVSLDCTIDANLLPDEGFSEVGVPMLHMSGTEGNHAVEIFERAAAADLTWVSLVGGCHESFTGTLECFTLPLEESLRATAAYTLAFGTRHLLGSSDPAIIGILDGSVEVSESAELLRSPGAQ